VFDQLRAGFHEPDNVGLMPRDEFFDLLVFVI